MSGKVVWNVGCSVGLLAENRWDVFPAPRAVMLYRATVATMTAGHVRLLTEGSINHLYRHIICILDSLFRSIIVACPCARRQSPSIAKRARGNLLDEKPHRPFCNASSCYVTAQVPHLRCIGISPLSAQAPNVPHCHSLARFALPYLMPASLLEKPASSVQRKCPACHP